MFPFVSNILQSFDNTSFQVANLARVNLVCFANLFCFKNPGSCPMRQSGFLWHSGASFHSLLQRTNGHKLPRNVSGMKRKYAGDCPMPRRVNPGNLVCITYACCVLWLYSSVGATLIKSPTTWANGMTQDGNPNLFAFKEGRGRNKLTEAWKTYQVTRAMVGNKIGRSTNRLGIGMMTTRKIGMIAMDNLVKEQGVKVELCLKIHGTPFLPSTRGNT